ncbi:MAG: diaminopimelate epimerase, partial [Candidatus Thermoplasmatota archaeon]|nr:diaminopimelate epimerase [Candidatus Thermoplasmatota archaeon]
MKFWKMHGLGNDYVVINNMDGKIKEAQMGKLAQRVCRCGFSIGADGLLLACSSKLADVRMRIFNPDGSEAEMCGNGIRCLAKYCYDNSIVRKKQIRIETKAGIKNVGVEIKNGNVKTARVDMGTLILEREKIPVKGTGKFIGEPIEIDGQKFKATCVSVGNPHCVIFVDGVEKFPVGIIGPKVENHALFPNRTNVEFIQILGKNEIAMRVWERGVGETSACGTG